MTEKNIQQTTKNSAIAVTNKQLAELEREIEAHKTDTSNIDEDKAKLEKIEKEGVKDLPPNEVEEYWKRNLK